MSRTRRLAAAAVLGALAAGCGGISSDVYRRGAIQAAYKSKAWPRANSPGRALTLVVPPFADLRGDQEEEQVLWPCAVPIASFWARWSRPDWLLWRDPVYAAYKPAAQDLAEVFAREFQKSDLFGAVRVDKSRADADLVLEGTVRELTLTWRPHFLGTSYALGMALGYLGLPMGWWSVRQTIELRVLPARGDPAALWSNDFRTHSGGPIAAYYGGDPMRRGYPARPMLEPVVEQALREVEQLLAAKGEPYWANLRAARGAPPGPPAPAPPPPAAPDPPRVPLPPLPKFVPP